MADFLASYKKMIPHECYRDDHGNVVAYSKTPGDHGGETYAGIARAYWPKWEGWLVLDSLDKKPFLNTLPALDCLVQQFYQANFWAPLQCMFIVDQDLADYVLDKGVNSGTGRVAKKLQAILGLKEDGQIGQVSIKNINRADPVKLLADLRQAYRDFYEAIVAHDPSQKQFLKSWLARC